MTPPTPNSTEYANQCHRFAPHRRHLVTDHNLLGSSLSIFSLGVFPGFPQYFRGITHGTCCINGHIFMQPRNLDQFFSHCDRLTWSASCHSQEEGWGKTIHMIMRPQGTPSLDKLRHLRAMTGCCQWTASTKLTVLHLFVKFRPLQPT